ncbi:MAG: prolipoprotein diacylglyceryl transferase [Parachlamydiaceae bacterium]
MKTMFFNASNLIHEHFLNHIQAFHPISWFYWDPPREAFTIPFIDHPVFWYGILFVTGFILAYFIINPILARYLVDIRCICDIDIKNWPLFISQLRSSSSPLIDSIKKECDLVTQKQLNAKDESPLTSKLQQGILDGVNRVLRSGSGSRHELEHFFPSSLASPKETAYTLGDRICWFTVAGTIIGARLGEVFFYGWPYFKEHPTEIFKVWHGGLASHGGVLGVMLALYLCSAYIQRSIPSFTFLRLLDYVAIPSALVAFFIRLGNFMNQEIVGTPTDLPWGVLFLHPAEDITPVPRHPVQLYEAAIYLVTFVILVYMWKKQSINEKPGALVGTLFILIFGGRFMMEFWKSIQESSLTDASILQIGQILSIPFIFLGFFLVWQAKRKFS